MAHLREDVPQEFADDERWYRYFTKKSLISLIISAALALGIIFIFSLLGSVPLGIVLGLAVGVVIFSLTVIKASGSGLDANGITYDVMALRVLCRKIHGRVFVSNNDREPEQKKTEEKKKRFLFF